MVLEVLLTVPVLLAKEEDPPAFISDHYYCKFGNTGGHNNDAYYAIDPIWDGLNCSISVNCTCCAHSDMPWFSQHFTKAQKTFIEATEYMSRVFPRNS